MLAIEICKHDFALIAGDRVSLARCTRLLGRGRFDPQHRADNWHARRHACRLLIEVGDGCAKLMDEQMRELPWRRIEVDEISAYVGETPRHMTPLDDPRHARDRRWKQG
jgi:hypothetical protein